MTNPPPLWRVSIAKWPAAQREEWEERAALVYDGCRSEGCTVEEAERRAWEIVADRWRKGER